MAEPTLRKNAPVTEPKVSPGCMIFAIGICGMGALLLWFLIAGWRQGEIVKGFTDEAPQEFAPLTLPEEGESQLKKKITEFANKGGQLELDPAELNALLAMDGPLKTYAKLIQVESITDKIRAKFCRQFNIPFGKPRYFNGFIHLNPTVHKEKGIQLETLEINAPGKTIDSNFQSLYAGANDLDSSLIGPLKSDPEAGRILQSIASVKLENGRVILTAKAKP